MTSDCVQCILVLKMSPEALGVVMCFTNLRPTFSSQGPNLTRQTGSSAESSPSDRTSLRGRNINFTMADIRQVHLSPGGQFSSQQQLLNSERIIYKIFFVDYLSREFADNGFSFSVTFYPRVHGHTLTCSFSYCNEILHVYLFKVKRLSVCMALTEGGKG